MSKAFLPRWTVQAVAGAAAVLVLNFALGAWTPSAQQPAPAASQQPAAGGCPEGFYGSPEKGCTDVNECSSANGGCHKLAACKNTDGSRVCGACPPDFQGDGYVGCFDVNECPNGDCSDRIPTDAATAAPPDVTTSGDATVAAVSEAGAPVNFTATAKDPKDGTRPTYCLPRSGSMFPIGETIVSCWASNNRGKIGRATLKVTVTKPAF